MQNQDEMQAKIAQWGKMEGVIKKKRKSGTLLSKMDSSVNRYFKLWCDGKFFVYYDEKPVRICSIFHFLTILELH
jgi:coproporphyrinogen III oxidase